jgi:hypothetical protein
MDVDLTKVNRTENQGIKVDRIGDLDDSEDLET